jgi:hypothetical protein
VRDRLDAALPDGIDVIEVPAIDPITWREAASCRTRTLTESTLALAVTS